MIIQNLCSVSHTHQKFHDNDMSKHEYFFQVFGSWRNFVQEFFSPEVKMFLQTYNLAGHIFAIKTKQFSRQLFLWISRKLADQWRKGMLSFRSKCNHTAVKTENKSRTNANLDECSCQREQKSWFWWKCYVYFLLSIAWEVCWKDSKIEPTYKILKRPEGRQPYIHIIYRYRNCPLQLVNKL